MDNLKVVKIDIYIWRFIIYIHVDIRIIGALISDYSAKAVFLSAKGLSLLLVPVKHSLPLLLCNLLDIY